MAIVGKILRIFARVAVFFLRKIPAALGVLLLAQIGLLYVSVSEVRVPAFVADILSDVLEKEGLKCTFGRLYLRNLTALTAEDVRVATFHGDDPLLHVRRCVIKLAPSAIIDGNPIPKVVFLDGVELFCPDKYSASGRSERLVSDGVLAVRREGGMIKISSARCRVAGASFVAFGEIPGTRAFFIPKSVPAEKFSPKTEPPVAGSGEKQDSEKKSSQGKKAAREAMRKKIASELGVALGALSKTLNRPDLRELLGGASFVGELGHKDNASQATLKLTAFLPSIDVPEAKFRAEKITATQGFSGNFAEQKFSIDGDFRIEAETVTLLGGTAGFSEPVFARADGLAFATRVPVDSLSNASPLSIFPKRAFFEMRKLRAATLSQGAFSIEGFRAEISPETKWGVPVGVRFTANAFSGQQKLLAQGVLLAGTGKPSLDFDYNFSFDEREILAFPQLRFLAKQDDLKKLRFLENPELRGNVRFSPGLKFSRANVELLAGGTECGDIKLCALNVAGTLTEGAISFPKIQAIGGNFLANADVFSELSKTGDFRVRAWGSINPRYIDGRLGWFWDRIWRDIYALPAERVPRADIEVHGNWGENWEYVFGAIAGENGWCNGVVVDKVRLRVFEDPLMIAAFDMDFTRGDDRVFGNLQWHYAMEPWYHYRDFRFLFNGGIPPKLVLQIIGEGLPEALSELETAGAGKAVVKGFFSGEPELYPDQMLVNIDGEVPGEFSFFGIRGENFRGKIFYDTGTVYVGDPFVANAGKGSISGKIRVKLPEVGHGADGSKVEISLNVDGVQRMRFEEALAAIGNHAESGDDDDDVPVENANSSDVPAEKSSEKIAENSSKKETNAQPSKPDESSVSGTFAGTMTLPDLDTLDGIGTLGLKEEKLFELQIFGGFSRLLSAMGIDLTTFNLNQAEGSFVVRDGTIFLPDARIFGESGEVDLQANIEIPELNVKGEAVFRNLRGTRIPLLGKIVKLGSASTELLPVEISGNAENLEWKILPTISRIWSTPDAKYGIPPEKKSSSEEE